eukprot:1146041-Pelagomonas_calceolata.AAC.21
MMHTPTPGVVVPGPDKRTPAERRLEREVRELPPTAQERLRSSRRLHRIPCGPEFCCAPLACGTSADPVSGGPAGRPPGSDPVSSVSEEGKVVAWGNADGGAVSMLLVCTLLMCLSGDVCMKRAWAAESRALESGCVCSCAAAPRLLPLLLLAASARVLLRSFVAAVVAVVLPWGVSLSPRPGSKACDCCRPMLPVHNSWCCWCWCCWCCTASACGAELRPAGREGLKAKP